MSISTMDLLPVDNRRQYRPAALMAAEFYENVARRHLALQHCERCHEAFFFPRSVCPKCLSPDIEWARGAIHGHVYSMCVVHRAQTRSLDYLTPVPFLTVEVLDGCYLVGETGDPSWIPCIGDEVEAVALPLTEGVALPVWRPMKAREQE